MYNFSFETQGANTYMVYQMGEDDVIDSLSLGMVKNNRIKGIAPILFTQMDDTKYLKYNITAKRSITDFFEGIVTRKRFLTVFSNIADAILAAEEYMIDTSMFILDLNYIFVDVTSYETLLICLPLESSEKSAADMSEFLKNIVFSTRYDQAENVDYVAKIISHLNGANHFSLSDFAVLLKRILNEGVQPSAVHSQSEPQILAQQASVPDTVTSTITAKQQKQTVWQETSVVERQKQPNKTQPGVDPFLVPSVTKEEFPAEQTDSSEADGDGQEMSYWYLMQHYSKKNKAIYDAQKARKKSKNGNGKSQKKSNKASNPKKFEIPGQENNEQIPDCKTPDYQVKQPQHQTTVNPLVNNYQSAKKTSSYSAGFGDTTVLNNSGGKATTVLNGVDAPQATNPHLIRIKNNERINLAKPKFRIGQEKSFVDYCITDNTAISRSHADFVTRDGEYFVIDINSRNHTYVDGVMLQSMREAKMSHGTKIKLANEEFEFRIY